MFKSDQNPNDQILQQAWRPHTKYESGVQNLWFSFQLPIIVLIIHYLK